MRRHDGRNPVDVDSEAVEQAATTLSVRAIETPEQTADARDTLDADLQAALDALPDAFRQAVWLRDVEELTYAEIAQVLDVPDRHGDVADLPRDAGCLFERCRTRAAPTRERRGRPPLRTEPQRR